MSYPKKIAVRLPNWMGDMVMSAAFLNQLHTCFPSASVDMIVKEELCELAGLLPLSGNIISFNKTKWPGCRGAYRFGKQLKPLQYDCFFCLPDSLSSAIMSYATYSIDRVGYNKEFRKCLLTHAYVKPKGMHRVREYLMLLEKYTGSSSSPGAVPIISLPKRFQTKPLRKPYIVCHFRSAAPSRRLQAEQAASITKHILKYRTEQIILTGSANERHFNETVCKLSAGAEMINLSGKLSIPQLAGLLRNARLMLSVDSGPAHLSNALGTPTIVLFGPGNESNTAPFRKKQLIVLRSTIKCSCGVRNRCKYGKPKCMTAFSAEQIAHTVKLLLNGNDKSAD